MTATTLGAELLTALDDAVRDAAKGAGAGTDQVVATHVHASGTTRAGVAAEAKLKVADIDRLGVEIQHIHMARSAGRDIKAQASALPGRLARLLPEPIEVMEVSATLGQAVLRTPVEHMQDGGYFDLEVQTQGDLILRRFRVDKAGERQPESWTLTRGQLGRLVDELG